MIYIKYSGGKRRKNQANQSQSISSFSDIFESVNVRKKYPIKNKINPVILLIFLKFYYFSFVKKLFLKKPKS